MVAILHYRLGQEDETIGILQQILKEDPSNLNVLQDLADVNRRSHRNDDTAAVECERLVKSELDRLGSKQDEAQLEEDVKVKLARCLAGQGFAWGLDIHSATKDTNKLDNSVRLYERALTIAGNTIDVKEREDWLYYLALGQIRQNNIRKIWDDRLLYLKILDKVVECLVPNLHCEDIKRRSAAWCQLGNVFLQRPRNATRIPKKIADSDLKTYWYQPEKCFLYAVEIDNQNYNALNRLAHLYSNKGKEEEALELLDKSLAINMGISNTYALHSRAQIHRMLFNKQLQRKTQKGGPLPDRRHLFEAKKDLLLCIQYNPYVLDMIHLAEIYHRLAWNEESSCYDATGLKEALEWCTKAEKYQDGAVRPDLYQRRGLILIDLEDIDGAIKCFLQAMDLEHQGTSYNKNFVFMFNAMLKRYHDCEAKPEYMLQELVHCLDHAQKKYSTIKINSFVTKYPEEMIRVAELLLSQSKSNGHVDIARMIVKSFRQKQASAGEYEKRLSIMEQKMQDTDLITTSLPISEVTIGNSQNTS